MTKQEKENILKDINDIMQAYNKENASIEQTFLEIQNIVPTEKDTRITLSGLDDSYKMEKETLERYQEICNMYDVEIYPTYYDYELKGTREAIERVTMDLWGMNSEEWADNGLIETKI